MHVYIYVYLTVYNPPFSDLVAPFCCLPKLSAYSNGYIYIYTHAYKQYINTCIHTYIPQNKI